jgi:hypothetical protein
VDRGEHGCSDHRGDDEQDEQQGERTVVTTRGSGDDLAQDHVTIEAARSAVLTAADHRRSYHPGMGGLKDICFDCQDPWTLGHWWAAVLGYRVRPHSEEDLAQLRREGIERPEDDTSIAVDPVDQPGPSVWFCRVPESKVVKNRVHLDVWGDADALIARGATLVEARPKWTVLADPEGNEFCVFTPES